MTVAVVLPGLDGAGSLRQDFADALLPRLQPVLLSYPTDRILGYGSLEDLVRKQLPSDEAYVLIAESFSGPLACRLAASQPPGLKALILFASFARSPLPLLYPFRSLARIAPVQDVPGVVLSWWLLGLWANGKRVSELRSAIANVEAAVLRARVREVLAVDVMSMLALIRCPVLGIRGSADRLIRAQSHMLIGSMIGDYTEAVVEGPHALLQAVPKACAERTIAFCQARGMVGAGSPLG